LALAPSAALGWSSNGLLICRLPVNPRSAACKRVVKTKVRGLGQRRGVMACGVVAMKGVGLVLLCGAVPLAAYVLALILDDSPGGTIAVYAYLASLAVWGAAMVLSIGIALVRLLRRRMGK
jgi:hypothetical protein